MRRWTRWACLLFVGVGAPACAPLGPRLTFPTKTLRETNGISWYDVNRDGKAEFGVGRGEVLYDDDQDGAADRAYRLSDYRNEEVSHLIILLDSIPYQVVAERYARGEFRYFSAPVKVIPVFPTLTEVCYTRVLGAPALGGFTDQYFDVRKNAIRSEMWERLRGWREPWERRLGYHAGYFEALWTYLSPGRWLPVEMERIHRALDASPDRVTIVYAVSASGMACKYGRAGMEKTLDEANRLCLQLLYERRGAIKITMMADHGHNLAPSRSATPQIERALRRAGFRPRTNLKKAEDVVIELSALVNYVGLRTKSAEAVAKACVAAREVEFAIYLSGSRVIVRDARGEAAIDCRGGAFKYEQVTRDVLGYQDVVDELRRRGKVSADGYVADRDWFDATANHQYPDAPRRLWDALHGLVVSPPDVLLTLKRGWHSGEAALEGFITMKSTHGSLDQINSATFVMTMTGTLPRVLRGGDVMEALREKHEIRSTKSETNSKIEGEKRRSE